MRGGIGARMRYSKARDGACSHDVVPDVFRDAPLRNSVSRTVADGIIAGLWRQDEKCPRVFDLHCDTIDGLALLGGSSVPDGFSNMKKACPAVGWSRFATTMRIRRSFEPPRSTGVTASWRLFPTSFVASPYDASASVFATGDRLRCRKNRTCWVRRDALPISFQRSTWGKRRTS